MNIVTVPKVNDDELNEFRKNSKKVKEGRAEMLFPYESTVFYNPVQEFNRDISLCAIKSFIGYKNNLRIKEKTSKKSKQKRESLMIEKNGPPSFISDFDSKLNIHKKPPEKIIIVEALAATGIRSIRYSLEIDSVYKIIVNDMQPHAVKTILLNSIHNNVFDKIVATKMEATNLLNQLRYPINYRPDVIDIDPYGSAAIFLDSAVQSISEAGLLCITCTDMASMCGNYPETTLSKYGSMALKSPFCHEMALRILLCSIDSTANRYKRYIVPLLSISVDFYIRVFVQVFTSAAQVKKSIIKKSYLVGKEQRENVYQAANAPIGYSMCPICSSNCKIGGPVWSDSIHNFDFISLCIKEVKANKSIYGTFRRIEGLLSVIGEELPDTPFYYVPDDMFSVIRSSTPPSLELHSAFAHLGYLTSYTHCKKNAFKTNAPSKGKNLFGIAWVARSADKKSHPNSIAGKNILSLPQNTTIDFTPIPSLNPFSRVNHLTRFQMNPAPNWGPMKRGRAASLEKPSKKPLSS
ncbi:LOW QUALITY PROTEIN: hypothetical protein HZS_3115 [Henneguya salminicola]|nr:LOW QUALITY PROTEIN: hypothetical protein HZS_3115 [Henneguya salminicola]